MIVLKKWIFFTKNLNKLFYGELFTKKESNNNDYFKGNVT
jgi:hypothetical protein